MQMIETRNNMQETTHEVNPQRNNNILHVSRLDMMKQFGSTWFFGIFSACLPVLKCVEESSTTNEPELQENLIRDRQNVMLAPPHFPLMLITDDNTSILAKQMQAFSNKINLKNDKDDWLDLKEHFEDTKPATPQVLYKHLYFGQIQFLYCYPSC